MKLKQKWKHLGASTYESTTGFRIHVGGLLVRMPDKSFISGFDIANHVPIHRFTRIMGGNRKRALMAWAEQMPGASNEP